MLLSKHHSTAAKLLAVNFAAFLLMTRQVYHAALQCCGHMQSEHNICFSKPAVCSNCAVVCNTFWHTRETDCCGRNTALSIRYWKSVVPPTRCSHDCRVARKADRLNRGKPPFKYTCAATQCLPYCQRPACSSIPHGQTHCVDQPASRWRCTSL